MLVGEGDGHPSAVSAQSDGDGVGVIVAVGDDPGAHVGPTDGLADGDEGDDGGLVFPDGLASEFFGWVSCRDRGFG